MENYNKVGYIKGGDEESLGKYWLEPESSLKTVGPAAPAAWTQLGGWDSDPALTCQAPHLSGTFQNLCLL